MHFKQQQKYLLTKEEKDNKKKNLPRDAQKQKQKDLQTLAQFDTSHITEKLLPVFVLDAEANLGSEAAKPEISLTDYRLYCINI